MALSPVSFFEKYIIEPLSPDLRMEEQAAALALSILSASLTLGIAHCVALCLRNHRIQNLTFTLAPGNHERYKRIAEKADAIAQKTLGSSERDKGIASAMCPLRQEQVPGIIQERMIEPFYAQPLPAFSEVEVPFRDGPVWDKVKWVKWCTLSAQEKIEVNNHYCHPHSRVPENIFGALGIDACFFGSSIFGAYVPRDPRKDHGSDHAVGTALFSAAFACLYDKYHPSYEVTPQQMILAQLLGAGHDSARQTEGTDVYDAKSAENTVSVLKDLGITDPQTLLEAEQAIADKDAKDLQKKGLLAKCVQNADSAQFYRLECRSAVQPAADFDHACSFLDIYNELKTLSGGDENFPLKNGLTYGDFLEELEAMRREMNLFIYSTHNKKMRQAFSQNGVNYFQSMTDLINHAEYPLLHATLLRAGVVQPIKMQSYNEQIRNRYIERYRMMQLENLEYVSTERLEKLKNKLDQFQGDEDCRSMYKALDAMLSDRTAKYKHFTQTRDLASYRALVPIERDRADDALNPHPCPVFGLHAALKNTLSSSIPGELVAAASKLLEAYRQALPEAQDFRVVATVADALQKAAHLYLKAGDREAATETLRKEAIDLPLDEQKQGFAFAGDTPVFLNRGGDSVRFRRLRVCKKVLAKKDPLDNGERIELSFELSSRAREELAEVLEMLKDDPPIQSKSIKSRYRKKDFSDKKYYHTQQGKKVFAEISILGTGKDRKIVYRANETSPPITMYIGDAKNMWTQYHTVRISMKPGTTVQQCHEALSSLGLPTVLMQSRPEDLRNEGLGRMLTLRFPDAVYRYQKQHGRKDFQTIFAGLNPEEQETLRQDLKGLKISHIGVNQMEVVNPALQKEAAEHGARALGFFVQAGNIAGTSQVMVSILRSGLLSTLERYQRGILSHGAVPTLNFWQGSANQVFTRTLTQNMFEEKTPFTQFTLTGPVLILIDPKIYNRMPYTYFSDCAGVRNPHLNMPVWFPFPQPPSVDFRGIKKMIERPPFPGNIDAIAQKTNVYAETMFDKNIDSKYFRKLIVQHPSDKYILMKELEKNGIGHLNGRPLDEAIMVAAALDPTMIAGWDSNDQGQ